MTRAFSPSTYRRKSFAVSFLLSGYLGGFASQRDLASLDLRFLDARGGQLGQHQLDPVTREERAAQIRGKDKTGLLPRRVEGEVPRGSRVLEVTLRCETATGSCDGYADNLSLVLNPIRKRRTKKR